MAERDSCLHAAVDSDLHTAAPPPTHRQARCLQPAMAMCFMIQPFKGRFDKIYDDTYAPAIEAAHIEPYRVDRDPAAENLIKQIEEGIRRADVCLADISEDNPNVWFELGLAIAARRPVVMTCDAFRGSFPFDIAPRKVIRYTTEAASDFEKLKLEVTRHLEAVLKRSQEVEAVSDRSPLAEIAGLTPHEMVALVAIASAGLPGDLMAENVLRQEMGRAGFAPVALTLAVRSLCRQGLVETCMGHGDFGEEYPALVATESGLKWLEDHQDQLVLRREPPSDAGPVFAPDDVPF